MGNTLACLGASNYPSSYICPYGRVIISTGPIEVTTTALIDGGSEATLITSALASMLSLKSKGTNIRLRTFHGIDPTSCVRRTAFTITSIDGVTALAVKCAYIVENLNMAHRIIDWQVEKNRWRHLADLSLQNFNSDDVGLLIGVNVIEAMVQLAFKKPEEADAPLAILTPFGWTVMGPVPLPLAAADTYVEHQAEVEEHNILPVHWLTNVFATSLERKEFFHNQEAEAWNILRSSIRMVNGHYELPLLWKSKSPDLPDNRSSALKSFFANESRCLRDPAYKKLFIELMDIYEKQGFSKRLSQSELQGVKGKTWYLNYFIVYHPRTHKPRMVFDASRRYNGRCLNDELHAKPNLILPLRTVLIRFRENPFAVNMDIKKMFFQVAVKKEDRCALRYVYRVPGSSNPPLTFEKQVQIFGAASSMTSSIFALHQTVLDNPDYADVSQRLLDCTYVDNYCDSYPDEESAIYGCASLIELAAKGGFPLVALMASSWNVLNSVPTEIRESSTIGLNFFDIPDGGALGTRWNCQRDSFVFEFTTTPTPTTKREMLRAIAKVFDPLGFLTPVLISCRVLLQSVWRKEREKTNQNRDTWDRKLPEDVLEKWNNITADWPCLSSLEIPRCLKTNQHPEAVVQLHIFCDASMDAKGVVSYLRVSTADTIDVAFIASKSAVAKINRETIPQAELQAATMGAREMTKLQKSLRMKINSIHFWVDSEAVLYWIRSPSRKNPRYVDPCRDFILSCTAPEQWCYVPSELNPADDITRGIGAKAFSPNHRFFKSSFLDKAEEHWPTQPTQIPTGKVLTEELLVGKAEVENSTVTAIASAESLATLKKSIADGIAGNRSVRTVNELHHALVKCIIAEQLNFFPLEIRHLKVIYI